MAEVVTASLQYASDEDLKAIYVYLHNLTPIEGPTK